MGEISGRSLSLSGFTVRLDVKCSHLRNGFSSLHLTLTIPQLTTLEPGVHFKTPLPLVKLGRLKMRLLPFSPLQLTETFVLRCSTGVIMLPSQSSLSFIGKDTEPACKKGL